MFLFNTVGSRTISFSAYQLNEQEKRVQTLCRLNITLTHILTSTAVIGKLRAIHHCDEVTVVARHLDPCDHLFIHHCSVTNGAQRKEADFLARSTHYCGLWSNRFALPKWCSSSVTGVARHWRKTRWTSTAHSAGTRLSRALIAIKSSTEILTRSTILASQRQNGTRYAHSPHYDKFYVFELRFIALTNCPRGIACTCCCR